MDYKVKLQLGNRGNHVVRTQSASGKQSPAHNQSSPLLPTAPSTVIFKIASLVKQTKKSFIGRGIKKNKIK